MRRFEFLADAHGANEWRYAHLDRPPHMDWEDWHPVAEWALYAAAPAVAESLATIPEQTHGLLMALERDVVRAIGSTSAPTKG
jgi:hypothetical protein